MYRLVLALFIFATPCSFGQDANELVKKAIQQTDEPEVQIERVIKRANGDVETVYVVKGKRVSISEGTCPVCPEKVPEIKKTPEPQPVKAAPKPIEQTKVLVVKPTTKPKPVLPALNQPVTVNELPGRPVMQTPARAPGVAQGFPSTRPTPANDVGRRSISLPTTIPMGRTTTSATGAGQGGGIKAAPC